MGTSHAAKIGMRDQDIRQSLKQSLLRRFSRHGDTVILEELGLCQATARIDLALVSGIIHGYEIKSEQDSLDRLPAQQHIYSKTLDKVTVVAAEKHIESLMRTVPEWWGIRQAVRSAQGIRTIRIRSDACNPRVNPRAFVEFLWKDDCLQVLRRKGLQRGYLGKSRDVLWDRLADILPFCELHELVLTRLKTRAPDPALGRPSLSGDSSRPFAKLSRYQVRSPRVRNGRYSRRPS
jgi:hypothetical protein